MMDLLLRRRQMMMAAEGPLRGYLIHGSPTISGNIMTPTAGGFIYTPEPFDPGDEPWEITTRTTRAGSAGPGEIICTVGSDGSMVYGYIWKGIKSGSSEVARQYASSNGTSWDLLNNYSTAGLMQTSGAANMHVIRNGTTYSFKTKSTTRSTTLATPPRFGCHIAFGGGSSQTPIPFTFDLSETYITIGGKLWWSAI